MHADASVRSVGAIFNTHIPWCVCVEDAESCNKVFNNVPEKQDGIAGCDG